MTIDSIANQHSSPRNSAVKFPRRRYWALSFFLIYHVAAIVIAPAPDSYLRRQIFPFFESYVKLFRLDSHWSFFAPDPASGILMRYRVADAAGKIQVFKLTEKLKRSDPVFMRMTSIYNKMPDANSSFLQNAANHFCKSHSDFNPVKIQFIEGHQIRFSPWAWRASKRPLEEESMKIKLHEWQACPQKK